MGHEAAEDCQFGWYAAKMATARRGKTYFGEFIGEEEALRQATAKRLCKLAAEVGRLEPWEMIGEENLIGVERPGGEQPDFVSVMGAAGVYRAVAVYPGVRGYAWFKEMTGLRDLELRRTMLTERYMIAVEYPEDPDELDAGDQELLAGCRVSTRTEPFQFRTVRPGCCPWYITEAEGAELADCLDAVLGVAPALAIAATRERLWPAGSNALPLVGRDERGWGVRLLDLQLDRPPSRIWLSEEEIATLPAGPGRGAVCVGSFVQEGTAVESDAGRPAVVEVVAVLDVQTGLALHLTMAPPGHWQGETLSAALAAAFRLRGALAETVYVAGRAQLDLLGELGSRLGFRVVVRENLPVMEAFAAALEEKCATGS